MSAVFKVFTLFELAWRGLTPDEQKQFRNSLLKMIGAIIVATGLGTWFLVVPALNQIGAPTPPTTGETEIKVVAREPGVAFDVKAFCDDPATKVGKTPMTDAPNGGNRYVALRGTESVNWADSPEGRNPSAMYYITAPDGNQTGQPVTVEGDAAACMKRKGR